MLSSTTLRRWAIVHRWTSLASTLFLLILCVTGLPLIFHDEIDQALGYSVSGTTEAAAKQRSIDAIIADVGATHPGRHVQFVLWDEDTPGVVALALGKAIDSPPGDNLAVYVDAATGKMLSQGMLKRGPMGVLLKLHGELFLGPFGPLAIGVIAILFLAALVSGVVVYAPFLRKEPFGTLRASSPRVRWLDLHNLVGMATLGWALVVGATGLINSWGDLAVQVWQATELQHMAAGAKPSHHAVDVRVDALVASAQARAPGMTPLFVAMPGSALTSRNHYGVFMRGDTPLTAHLLKPVLVDAGTGAVAASADLPWYMQMLFLAQPLHFGDYGGLPLKIVWVVFDLNDRRPRQRSLPMVTAPPTAGRHLAGATRTRQPARHWLRWAEPALLVVVSVTGLTSALLADGAVQMLGDALLAIPLLAILRHTLTPKDSR